MLVVLVVVVLVVVVLLVEGLKLIVQVKFVSSGMFQKLNNKNLNNLIQAIDQGLNSFLIKGLFAVAYK